MSHSCCHAVQWEQKWGQVEPTCLPLVAMPCSARHAVRAGMESCGAHTSHSCCHAVQCEQEWNQVEPTCMCGFAMDREGAEALLQYHPPGAFLVRICQEPGSFSISCRVNPQPENDADVEAGSGEYNKERR